MSRHMLPFIPSSSQDNKRQIHEHWLMGRTHRTHPLKERHFRVGRGRYRTAGRCLAIARYRVRVVVQRRRHVLLLLLERLWIGSLGLLLLLRRRRVRRRVVVHLRAVSDLFWEFFFMVSVCCFFLFVVACHLHYSKHLKVIQLERACIRVL